MFETGSKFNDVDLGGRGGLGLGGWLREDGGGKDVLDLGGGLREDGGGRDVPERCRS
jgi:hypothetical protein